MDTITANPIMNVAFTSKGQATILPLQWVSIKTPESEASVLVNYAFGSAKDGVVRFESEIGLLKKLQLDCIERDKAVTVIAVAGGTAAEVQQEIVAQLQNAAAGQKLLLVWERRLGDDTPFYEALGLRRDGVISEEVEPVSLSELRLQVAPPFIELDLDETGILGQRPGTC